MAGMSKLASKLSSRNSAVFAFGVAAVWLTARQFSSIQKHRKEIPIVIGDHPLIKKDRAAVDAVFYSQLKRILKIILPGWFSAEGWYMFLVAVALAARTYCDVWMIQNGTAIESSIIGRNVDLFKSHLYKFIYAMPVISIVNNTLKYGLNELKLRFRTRLSYYLFQKYLKGFTYYKMSNLDNRIANADHLLTQDVEKLCTSIGDLYSNLSKPLIDIILYSAKLASAIGPQGPSFMLMYLVVSGFLLTRLRRPVGKMTMKEQKLEAEFRYVNSRLITNCEEVAFYQGNRKEQSIILSTLERLVDHLRSFVVFRFAMGFVDNVVGKYIATVVGYLVVSRPFLNLSHPRHLTSTHGEVMEDYYQSGRMLVKMAEAIGRVVLAGRELTRLAGFTSRITELMNVLDDLNRGRYERSMVSTNDKDKTAERNKLRPGSGTLIMQDHIIRFEHVPLVTPNGDILVEELNFEVKSGKNVLVCGPNGCGKSSLFRILGELWPLFGGRLTKPAARELFYIPQRPYMTLGTLRDQVIYPDSQEDMLTRGVTDSDLKATLEKVQLSYIVERDGGLDAVQDFMDVLSGGEKQRIAMARLFYHRPQFAILDECTSAVSVDVEGFMYEHCRQVGITLFTVSHRKSLWKHHEYYLHMDGRGGFEFLPITSDTVEFGS